MSYVNLGGLGWVDRSRQVRSLLPAGRPRGFGAPARPVPPPLPIAIVAALLRAEARRGRRGMGAYATGLCAGGMDTGDGSPCTSIMSGGHIGWSTTQLAAYNANLNPGVRPLTAQDLINDAAMGAELANAVGNGGGYQPGPPSMVARPPFQRIPQPLPPTPLYAADPYAVGNAPGGGSVSISDNVTGSSSTLTAGNPFTLMIRGARPGGQVHVQVGSWGTVKGVTDSQGNYTLNDITPSTPQGQSQQWTVDGFASTPSPLSFSIVANPNAPAGGGGGGASPGGVVSPGGGFDLGFLKNSVSLFGFNVPVLGLVGAGLVGAYLFSGGGSGKHR